MSTEETGVVSGLRQPSPPSLVLLREGSSGPPIFIAHGLGSSADDLRQLARQLRVSHPVYGMQARGTDGHEAPLDRIEAMAEFHLDAIRQLQPHGPYFLIGYSLGGVVSLEIARRLSAAGEPIALLALLDSYPYRSYLPSGQHVRLLMRLAKLRMASVFRSRETRGKQTTQALELVKDAQLRAWRNYRPHFYDGKIRVVKAERATFLPDDPAAVWASLVREIQIETVPGDHLTMLTTHSETVARVLMRHLDGADAAPSNGD